MASTVPTVSPMDMRLAFEYMKRGMGWHRIVDNPNYDEVLVREMLAWNKLPGYVPGVTHGAIMQVAFMRAGERVRYVDFAVLATGTGGEPVLKLVQSTPDDPNDVK